MQTTARRTLRHASALTLAPRRSIVTTHNSYMATGCTVINIVALMLFDSNRRAKKYSANGK